VKQDNLMLARSKVIETLVEAEKLTGRDLLSNDFEEFLFCQQLNVSPIKKLKEIEAMLNRDIERVKAFQSNNPIKIALTYLKSLGRKNK
jgi:hypothetical protein